MPSLDESEKKVFFSSSSSFVVVVNLKRAINLRKKEKKAENDRKRTTRTTNFCASIKLINWLFAFFFLTLFFPIFFLFCSFACCELRVWFSVGFGVWVSVYMWIVSTRFFFRFMLNFACYNLIVVQFITVFFLHARNEEHIFFYYVYICESWFALQTSLLLLLIFAHFVCLLWLWLLRKINIFIRNSFCFYLLLLFFLFHILFHIVSVQYFFPHEHRERAINKNGKN